MEATFFNQRDTQVRINRFNACKTDPLLSPPPHFARAQHHQLNPRSHQGSINVRAAAIHAGKTAQAVRNSEFHRFEVHFMCCRCARHAHACGCVLALASCRCARMPANAPNGALTACDRVSHLRFKKADGGMRCGPEPDH